MTVKNTTHSHLICRVSTVANSSNILFSILPISNHNFETREVMDSDQEDKCLTFRLTLSWLTKW